MFIEETGLLPRNERKLPSLLDWPRVFAAAEHCRCLPAAYGIAERHPEGRFWLARIERLGALGANWLQIRETVDQVAFLVAMETHWDDPCEILPEDHRPLRCLWAGVRMLAESAEPFKIAALERVARALALAVLRARTEQAELAA